MIFVAPILSIIAVVLTGSFLLRVGRPLYREKGATAIFALGVGFITFVIAKLGARVLDARHDFIGIGLTSMDHFDRWLYLRQVVTTTYGLVPLAALVYLAILVRRDFAPSTGTRSLFKDSVPMVIMALLFAGLSLFQNI